MPEIIPFRGLIFNQKKIKDLSCVVAPPYDVIPRENIPFYYNSHPYNVIRLIRGEGFSTDTHYENRYIRAARCLTRWIKEKVLIADPKAAIYLYSHQFIYKGMSRTRLGFISLMSLEDSQKNMVFPHESTFPHHKRDRLALLKEVQANLCPIFLVFSDPDKRITNLLDEYAANHKPFIRLKKNDEIHRVWRIIEQPVIDRITLFMEDRCVFIADGHHRYEVAYQYRHRYPWVMAYFCSAESPGLLILPIHRVVRTPLSIPLDLFKEKRMGSKKALFSAMEKEKDHSGIFGLYQNRGFYMLKFKSETSRRYNRLDVHLLHTSILKGKKAPDIYYTVDVDEAIKMVNKGGYRIAFFLNPTNIEEVKRVAYARHRMPRKSTFFYPKLLTGLVINKFERDHH